jgi:putative ABC transport system permease protein
MTLPTTFERTTREVRHMLRSLRRSPGFGVSALVILTLGIGMATAMFAVVDAVLLRPLPVHTPDQLVLLRTLDPSGTDVSMSQDEIHQLLAASRTLASAAGVAHQGAFSSTVLDGDRALSLRAAWVTGNFFAVLGTRPLLGRFFTPAEESATGQPTPVVLSYETWRRDFGGDPAVVGRQLSNPYTRARSTIIGVAPAGLAYPAGVELWTPVVYSSLDVVGRLKPRATVAGARKDFSAIMRRVDSLRVAHHVQGASIVAADARTLVQAVLGDVRLQLSLMSGAAMLLLLIACVNVGGVMLLRATSRGSEIAVRRSLGASPSDIVRPLLWECGTLGMVGGALGLFFAAVLLRLLVRLAPVELPRVDVLRLSGAPFGASAVVTVLALVFAALIPSLAAARGSLAAPLRLDARAGRGGAARRRVRHLLVGSQMALALVLLTFAALLVRSLQRLDRVPLGYQPSHLTILTLAKPIAITGDTVMEQFLSLYDRAEPGLRAVPGVIGLSPVVTTPFYGAQVFTGRWTKAGESDAAAAANPLVAFEVGGPEYFSTMQIPLLRGRGFLETDRAKAPAVVVVSRSVARRFWPGENPVGKRMKLVGDTGAAAWHTVVGEAGDIRYRNMREPTPTVYGSWAQMFFQGVVAVRTSGPITAALPALRRALHTADPEATITSVETMDELVDRQLALPRLSTLLLVAFGSVALVLAGVGLYGTMTATVRERTRELGIRAALGATPGRLRKDVLWQAGRVAFTGGGVGLAAAFAASRLIRSQLFEISPGDPAAMLAACAVLLAVALCAAALPAWRATRINPAQALGSDGR